MKINYLDDSKLTSCQNDIQNIYEEVFLHKRKTITQLYGWNEPLCSMSVEGLPFKLQMPDDTQKNLTDSVNARIVYQALQGLTPSQASDERIWAAYALFVCQDYINWRWAPKSAEQLKQHCFFDYSPHRSLFRHGIARLWWVPYVTYLQGSADPFALSDFCFAHTDIIQFICEQPVCQNPAIMQGAIQAMYDLDELNKKETDQQKKTSQAGQSQPMQYVKIDKNVIQELGKFLNLRAGTYLLDLMSKDDIYAMVKRHIQQGAGLKI